MSQSCLTDPSQSVFADASVLINLNASGCAAAILRALPNRISVVDTALLELRMDRRTARDDARLARALVNDGLLNVVALADLKLNYFEDLVTGRAAETLDDGEAATIAAAIERGAAALIDERKAISLCSRRFPSLGLARTVDVFAHDAVEKALGRIQLGDAVFAALQNARMRVAPHHDQWVVTLIGSTRTEACPSLSKQVRASNAKQNNAACEPKAD